MKILLLAIGKINDQYLSTSIEKYTSRINHYVNFQINDIYQKSASKKLSFIEYKNKEAELIMKKLLPSDYVILLDEKGDLQSSINFSKKIQSYMNRGISRLVFIIGGAYGSSEKIFNRSDHIISLSKMTFSHQMARLFFVEQLYRAYTIIKNESYHHQ